MNALKQRFGLSQETLKLIACLTMLLDHIGVILIQSTGLRIVGRISFPIFCFLLVEGVYHTSNPRKYGTRLLISVFLSELAYDLARFGQWNWQKNSVMITLFLGFVALSVIKSKNSILLKVLLVCGVLVAARFLGGDYGWFGVIVILMFGLTRRLPFRNLIQLACLLLLFVLYKGGIASYAVFAIIPIALYSGKKVTSSKAAQWAFYLFYPVHLLVLYFIGLLV